MPETSSHPQLSYNLFGPPHGQPVVLVNGLGGVQAAFLHQVRALADHFRVLTYDHRGVGGSEVVDSPATVRTFAEDLVRLLDELEWKQPVFALGLSFGGRVLQELALGWPGRIGRLVLGGTSPGGALHVPGDPEAYAALRTLENADEVTWREVIAPALFGSRYREKHPNRIQHLARWRARHPADPVGIARQWEAMESFDVSDRLDEIDVPVLIVHGRDDRLSPLENAEVLHEHLPDSRLVLLDDIGHSPNVEDHDKFNLIIRDFLLKGEP